jgi:hypothetical protein
VEQYEGSKKLGEDKKGRRDTPPSGAGKVRPYRDQEFGKNGRGEFGEKRE